MQVIETQSISWDSPYKEARSLKLPLATLLLSSANKCRKHTVCPSVRILSLSVAGSILPVFADKLSSLNKGDTIWLAKAEPNFSQLNLSGLSSNSLKRRPLFPRGVPSQRKVETTASSLVVSRSYQNHQHNAVSVICWRTLEGGRVRWGWQWICWCVTEWMHCTLSISLRTGKGIILAGSDNDQWSQPQQPQYTWVWPI